MRKALFYYCLLLLASACVTAQPNGNELKRKDQKLLSEVRNQLEARRWSAAGVSLDKLIASYPDNSQLYYLRSTVRNARFDYVAAAEDIQAGINADPKANGRAYQELGEALSKAGEFARAKEAYDTALELRLAAGRETTIARARVQAERARIADSLARNPVPFTPTEVPGLINTKASFEYHPTLSVDGKRLIFTRRVNREQEDFYVSERTEDGPWKEATPLPGINTAYDEGAQTVTADGSYMVYTSCNSPSGSPGCDLYESYWDGKSWSPGSPITDEGINTQHYEAQPSLTNNGRYLMFSSKRPGGKGGADLYISGRLTSGGWSRPIPIVKLNTPGNEQYPFWAADGERVFFTSDGLPGLGGDDLFYTQLTEDNKFTEPQNLGYPINTAENETNMFIPLSAEVAYYSKRYFDAETEQMQIDLFQFPLPLHLRPRPATYVKASVTDAVTGRPLEASVSVQATTTNQLAYRQTTDAAGSFLTVLPAGNAYAFLVDKPGYLYYSERFTPVADATPDNPFLVNIALRPLPDEPTESAPTTFNNVLFTTGSAELLRVSITELQRLADALLERPDLRVRIGGHTDDIGDEADNLALSNARAAAVKAYLVEAGVATDRVETQGYGETEPVATNDTEGGRSQNRRTTFQWIK